MDRDGNPILDGYSHTVGRAFQIIQWDPAEAGEPLVGGYVERFDDPIYEGSVFPPIELTISVVLTDVTLATVRGLLTLWMDPRLPVETTENALDDL